MTKMNQYRVRCKLAGGFLSSILVDSTSEEEAKAFVKNRYNNTLLEIQEIVFVKEY